MQLHAKSKSYRNKNHHKERKRKTKMGIRSKTHATNNIIYISKSRWKLFYFSLFFAMSAEVSPKSIVGHYNLKNENNDENLFQEQKLMLKKLKLLHCYNSKIYIKYYTIYFYIIIFIHFIGFVP